MTTVVKDTEPGTVMGTASYMSPEQASGKAVDFRSDQFSLGSILYEMATGQRAFQRGTGAETLTAIIREEPQPVEQVNPTALAPLRWIVERCLAKDPEERYASTRDLARDLRSIREHLSESSVSGGSPVVAVRHRGPLARILLGTALLTTGLASGVLVDRLLTKSELPSFHQLTFRRGTIVSARFAPDGQTILYGAAWDGRPFEVFSARPESTVSRSLGLPPADLFAISSSGEMALSLNRRFTSPYISEGTLAQAPLAGGAHREVLGHVLWADWAPGAQGLAVVRDVGGRNRLEFPIGKPLYETAGHVSHPRFSPQGDLIAFQDHAVRGGDFGAVAVVDRNGRKRDLSAGWESLWGLAWSYEGDEVWFTGARTGSLRALYAVSRSGRLRLLARVAGALALQDVYRDGRVLLLHDEHRLGMLGFSAGKAQARDLSYLDYSATRDLSADGRLLLFDESGEGGGGRGSVYLRGTDGSPPVRLGEGASLALSPDRLWALSAHVPPDYRHFVLLPVGVGQPRSLPLVPGEPQWADWLPNGKEILFASSEAGHGARLYLQDIENGRIRAVSGEGVTLLPYSHLITPNSRFVAARGPDQKVHLYPLDGGSPGEIPGLDPGEDPIRWTGDGRALYIYRPGDLPARIFRMDLASGRRELWRELMPPDPVGVISIRPPLLTSDASVCVYSYSRFLSSLFLVEGLK